MKKLTFLLAVMCLSLTSFSQTLEFGGNYSSVWTGVNTTLSCYRYEVLWETNLPATTSLKLTQLKWANNGAQISDTSVSLTTKHHAVVYVKNSLANKGSYKFVISSTDKYGKTITKTGTVELPGNGPKGDTTNCNPVKKNTDDAITGINNESPQNLITVYPNPAHDYVTIENSTKTIAVISVIYSMDGRKVMEHPIATGTNRIEIMQLPKGLYFLQIEGFGTTKLLIE